MSSSGDSTFTLQKKRRRSSLFINRPASSINDSTDTAATATSIADSSDAQLTNYIAQLKNCKRSWRTHERELKSRLTSSSVIKVQCKEYEVVQNNYLDYLDEEDRKFMEDVVPLLHNSAVKQKVDGIREKIKLLSSCYDQDKIYSSLIAENINQAVRCCVALKLNDYDGKDKNDVLDDSEDRIDVSETAPQILEYNSDVSDFDESFTSA
ncbi:hypothetical protein GE061_018944 [Apolygus lucorum]|uniref:Uncharacterized protein n=1 Tax=Apolygus lucorum TaxID=248454 RepID=A0A8S9X710_APOLU|nr:hypothetical protein GE061_018944 [Apolygus lucorum]